MRRIHYLIFLFCMVPLFVQAQTYRISGKVTDASDKSPMAGVTVDVKDKASTMTDVDGNYQINVSHGDVIKFSFIGMQPQTVKVESDKSIDIALSEGDINLDELVFVGYGVVKKKDLTGAVAQIKASDILTGNPTSGINQALQGRLAGVAVSQNDGAPGAGINIQIRGANTFSGDTEPLYVIDGIPFLPTSTPTSGSKLTSDMKQTVNPLASINPQDIESIDVLKDASATAIYGSRGANGVILITTKKGKDGRNIVEFSSNLSLATVAKKMNMISAADYAQYQNEQKIFQSRYEGTVLGLLPYPGKMVIDLQTNKEYYLPSPDDYRNRPGEFPTTDWQDVIFQNALSQEYNLAVSGGTDKGSYSFSGNVMDQAGIIENSAYTRYSLRANNTRIVNNWLEIGTNLSFSHSLNKLAKTNAADNGIIKGALFYPSTREKVEPNNDQQLNWFSGNPYWHIQTAKDWVTTENFFSSSYLEIKPLKDLRFRQNVGFSYFGAARETYYGRKTREGKDPVNGFGAKSDNYSLNATFESILTYQKTFNKIHSLTAMGAGTIEKGTYGNKFMNATGFPNDMTLDDAMDFGTTEIGIGSGKGKSAMVSFLARANYSLMDKYLITASLRRDGSSRFMGKNRWSNFFSGALAWRASEESFIKNLNVFDNLKLRTSYGETGNQAISPYSTKDQYIQANYPLNGSLQNGLANDPWKSPANPFLIWETTRQVDFGLDMGFLNNRLSFVVDYYDKDTKDLLQGLQTPYSTGFTTKLTNFGKVRNKGWEFSTSYVAIDSKDITLDFHGNISFNKNKITIEDDQFTKGTWSRADNAFIQRNGYPIGTILGFIEDGFYDSEAEVRADPAYGNPAITSEKEVLAKVGEIKYKNFDDDPNIGDGDRQIIGDVNPDFIYGLTTNFRYKNFTGSFFFQGTKGNDIVNGNLFDINMSGPGNLPQFIYDSRWTPENKMKAEWPKPYGGHNREIRFSDRYIEDGSYLRLKNVNVGYAFNKIVKGIETIRLSASVSNVFTITKYSWYDPDVNAFGSSPGMKGVDLYSYPTSRTFSFGLVCTF